MAEFRSWRLDFDSNEGAIVKQKRVGDPPGHDLAAAREMVSTSSPVNYVPLTAESAQHSLRWARLVTSYQCLESLPELQMYCRLLGQQFLLDQTYGR